MTIQKFQIWFIPFAFGFTTSFLAASFSSACATRPAIMPSSHHREQILDLLVESRERERFIHSIKTIILLACVQIYFPSARRQAARRRTTRQHALHVRPIRDIANKLQHCTPACWNGRYLYTTLRARSKCSNMGDREATHLNLDPPIILFRACQPPRHSRRYAPKPDSN